jgi:hypothetical protein
MNNATKSDSKSSVSAARAALAQWPADRTDGGRTRHVGLLYPEAVKAALDWAWS